MIINKNQIFGQQIESTNSRLKVFFGGATTLSILLILLFWNFDTNFGSIDLLRSDVTSGVVPILTSIEPPFGEVGDLIKINGKGFALSPDQNQVFFDDKIALVEDVGQVSNDIFQLIVRVPDISKKGFTSLTIKNLTNGGIASKQNYFNITDIKTINDVISINNITPMSGPVGTVVYLQGENLPTTLIKNDILFGDVLVKEKSIVYQNQIPTIKIVVPDEAKSGPITLMNKEISIVSDVSFFVTDNSDVYPIINKLSETKVNTGDKIQIIGSNLYSDTKDSNNIIVKFNDAKANIIAFSKDKSDNDILFVTVPDNATSGYVTVMVNGKLAISEKSRVTVLNAKKILPNVFESRNRILPTTITPKTTELSFHVMISRLDKNTNIDPISIDLTSIGGEANIELERGDPEGDTLLNYRLEKYRLTNPLKIGTYSLTISTVDEQKQIKIGKLVLSVVDDKIEKISQNSQPPIINVFDNYSYPSRPMATITEKISFYTFISDPNGAIDIKNVTLDLTDLGGSILTLTPGDVFRNGAMYSFLDYELPHPIDPNIALYKLPIRVTDQSGQTTEDEFKLEIYDAKTLSDSADLPNLPNLPKTKIDSVMIENRSNNQTRPTNILLTATVSSNAVLLTWDRDFDSQIENYYVYFSSKSGPKIQRIIAGLVNPFYVTNLLPGKKYFFEVRGVTASGEEVVLSNEASIIYPHTYSLNNSTQPSINTEFSFNLNPSAYDHNHINQKALSTPYPAQHQSAYPEKLSKEGPTNIILFSFFLSLLFGFIYRKKNKVTQSLPI